MRHFYLVLLDFHELDFELSFYYKFKQVSQQFYYFLSLKSRNKENYKHLLWTRPLKKYVSPFVKFYWFSTTFSKANHSLYMNFVFVFHKKLFGLVHFYYLFFCILPNRHPFLLTKDQKK